MTCALREGGLTAGGSTHCGERCCGALHMAAHPALALSLTLFCTHFCRWVLIGFGSAIGLSFFRKTSYSLQFVSGTEGGSVRAGCRCWGGEGPGELW